MSEPIAPRRPVRDAVRLRPVRPRPVRPRPVRSALPTSTEGLPALEPEAAAIITAELDRLDLAVTGGVRRAIDDQVRLLLAWNGAINLTAIRDPVAMAREHVVDSLTALPLLRQLGPPRADLLDLGSGAGYPGLPLGLALPARRLALVESVAKKSRFLDAAAAAARRALGAPSGPGAAGPATDVVVLAGRAEELGRDARFAAGWDIVMARAVAPLDRLVTLSFPFLRPGGSLVAWKRDAGDGRLGAELAAADDAIRAAGGGRPEVVVVTAAGLEDHRLVVVHRLP